MTIAGALVIFVGVILVIGGVSNTTGRTTRGSLSLAADMASVELPAWINLELRDSRSAGTFSSGGCMRNAGDIQRAIDALALNLPRRGGADELAITMRVSWRPERPRWMGAAPVDFGKCP